MDNEINAMSLFANIGVAEAYLGNTRVRVRVANEFMPDRAEFYSHFNPGCEMVVGDISRQETKDRLISLARDNRVDLIMATPPCQGMSVAGSQDPDDPRNNLIYDTVQVIRAVMPRFVFLENVPQQAHTKITYNGKKTYIPDFIRMELENDYEIVQENINSCDYGVAQDRKRLMFLMTRKGSGTIWEFPAREKHVVTLREAIGDLPPIDPEIANASMEEQLEMFPLYGERKAAAESVSRWHTPPRHSYMHARVMSYTPTGQTAFDNPPGYQPEYQGRLVTGHRTAYKRNNWDTPAYTITMTNGSPSSYNNVHPGRFLGMDKDMMDVYSDARVFTLLEIFRIMSLPDDWLDGWDDMPKRFNTSFIRKVIGEGIPPLLMRKIMDRLPA